jgi:hypothetical protein
MLTIFFLDIYQTRFKSVAKAGPNIKAIVFCLQRRFYGPKHRWMFLSGIIRPSVWMSIFRSSKKVTGNLKGEGRLLGGKDCICYFPSFM